MNSALSLAFSLTQKVFIYEEIFVSRARSRRMVAALDDAHVGGGDRGRSTFRSSLVLGPPGSAARLPGARLGMGRVREQSERVLCGSMPERSYRV